MLVDTGAAKMWMARLYPTYERNTCLISNGLSTMAFALPGALGVKLAKPDVKVLAVVGDGAFLMNSQEIETAVRERIPLVVLIWEDGGYGLIEWKMDLELGEHYYVSFTNPDVVAYAESFGAKGYRVTAADQLLPTLKAALDDDGVSLIACPVDYSENLRLTDTLGQLGRDAVVSLVRERELMCETERSSSTSYSACESHEADTVDAASIATETSASS